MLGMRRTLCLLIIGLALSEALSAAAGTARWLQVGYNAGHTGFNPREQVISSQNAGSLQLTGTFATAGEIEDPVVVGNGIAYVNSYDGNLYAVDLATDQQKWSFPAAPYGTDWSTGEVLAGKTVIVSCSPDTNHNGFCGVDAKTGKQNWDYAPDQGSTTVMPPAISGTTAYLAVKHWGTNELTVTEISAVTANTGAIQWTFSDCNKDNCATVGSGSSPFSFAPAIDGGLVYFGCSGGEGHQITITGGVCAVSATTGQLVWQYELDDGNGRLTARAGTVYAVSQPCCSNPPVTVTAIGEASGTQLWSVDIASGESAAGPPAFEGGDLYVPIAGTPDLYALKAKNGRTVWSATTDDTLYGAQPTTVAPGNKNGVIFLSCSPNSGSAVCAFNESNGAELWQSDYGHRGGSGGSNPIVTGGAVYGVCSYNDLCTWTPQM